MMNGVGVELRHLEHFLAVAEERHFGRAADRLHIVQSGLSASVRALERELGVALFARTTRQVRLTPEGEALLEPARRTLSAAEQAREAVTTVRDVLGGRLTVGILQLLAVGLPELVERFRAEYPRVDLRLHQAPSETMAEQVTAGELDVAFLCHAPTEGDLLTHPISDRPLLLVVPAGHRLAGQQTARVSSFVSEPFVDYPRTWGARTQTDAFLAARGLRRTIVCEVGDTLTLLEMVAHGMGVALVPDSQVASTTPGIRVLRVRPPGPSSPLALALPRWGGSAAARAFSRIALDHVRAHRTVDHEEKPTPKPVRAALSP